MLGRELERLGGRRAVLFCGASLGRRGVAARAGAPGGGATDVQVSEPT